MDIADVCDAILGMDQEQLSIANKTIRQRWNELDARAKLRFKVGDRVKFQTKGRGIVTGVVERLLPRNMQILSDSGKKWRVSPTLLEAVDV